VALALALARELPAHDTAVRAGRGDRRPGRELAGRTWGLPGGGATGQAVARLAAGLQMTVRASDPYAEPPAAKAAGVDLVSLEALLETADVLSIHLPLTPQTRGLLGAQALARLRPGTMIVNVGRGEVVDEAALASALRSGQVGAAGLDVRATEPPQPGPLDDAPHVLFTPHVAGITVESQQRITAILAEDIAAVLGGGVAGHAAGARRRSWRAAAERDPEAAPGAGA
jgi:phosphoglycerate dehydrogenase-like enzyme